MNGRERLRRALGIDYPQGDRTAQPSGHMPVGGYFFDAIIRQPPIDEDHLDPTDNLEEFGPVAAADLDHYRRASGAGGRIPGSPPVDGDSRYRRGRRFRETVAPVDRPGLAAPERLAEGVADGAAPFQRDHAGADAAATAAHGLAVVVEIARLLAERRPGATGRPWPFLMTPSLLIARQSL
jgi:hypothetical protein